MIAPCIFFPLLGNIFYSWRFLMDVESLVSTLVVVCPLVFLASLVDAVAGGGGLISLPAYLLAGFSPHAASATNKCSSSFGAVFVAGQFIRKKQFHLPSSLVAVPSALVGAYLGARLNLYLDGQILYYIMLIIVPVMAIFLFFKRDFGDESLFHTLPKKKLLAYCCGIGLVLGAYDGFFGPGTGTFLMFAFTGICKFDLLMASGNTKMVNTASNLASLVTFALAGEVVWVVGLPAAACSIVGGLVGGHLALKGGGKIIRPMFVVVLGLMIIRLAWDLLT